MDLEQIITSRHSVRAFTEKKVSKEIVKDMLKIASRAPSATNTQPWNVYVVAGKKRDEISSKVCKIFDEICLNSSLAKDYVEQYRYYPEKWISPYIDRRRANGWGLYGLLNIQKGEKEKMMKQEKRNYEFFDAPIGIFFTTNKIMGEASKMDIAMFMQNFMLLANNKGLATCAQAAWNKFHSIVLPLLGANEDEMLIAALCLGYEDKENIVNSFITPREDVDSFTKWIGL